MSIRQNSIPTENIRSVVVLAQMIQHGRQDRQQHHVYVDETRRSTLQCSSQVAVALLFEVDHRLMEIAGDVIEQRQERSANHFLAVLHDRSARTSFAHPRPSISTTHLTSTARNSTLRHRTEMQISLPKALNFSRSREASLQNRLQHISFSLTEA